MQFKDGATVYTSQGEEVGRVDRVVMDPVSKEVTHLVVRKGILLTEDRVVPLEFVASAREDQVRLRKLVADLEDLPHFEVEQYVHLSQKEIERSSYPAGFAPPLYWYPSAGASPIGYPGYPGAAFVVQVERNIPDFTVALKAGAKVIASGGDRVGEVAEVITDPEDNRATHFVISKGVLFKYKVLIPVLWISGLQEDEVHLNVGPEMLADLPEYQGQA